MAEEVGPQREQDQRPALRVPRRFDERVDERPTLLLGDRRREQLLELVDGEDKSFARRHALERAASELRRRSLAGTDEQRASSPERRQQAGTEE